MKKTKDIIIAILLLIILGGFIYFILDKNNTEDNLTENRESQIYEDYYVGMGVKIGYPASYSFEENTNGVDFLNDDEAKFTLLIENIEDSCIQLLCEIENYSEKEINSLNWKVMDNLYCYQGGCYETKQDFNGIEITDTTYYITEKNGIRYILHFWDENNIQDIVSNFSI